MAAAAAAGKLPKRDLGLVVFFLDGDSFEARGELRGDMSRCTAEGGSGSMDGAGGVLVVVWRPPLIAAASRPRPP